MATLGSLIVDIVANTTALKQGLDQARQQTNAFTRDMEAAIKRTQQSLGVDRVAAGMSFAASGTAKWQEGLRRLADQARDTGRGVNAFGGDITKLGDHLGDAFRQLTRFTGGFGGLGNVLTSVGGKFGAVVAGIGATTAALLKLTEVGANEQRSQLRLEAVIRATGGAAGISAKEIKALSDELENRSLFDDREIRQAATQLATFGNIQGQVFRDTLRLGVDIAEVFETDVVTAVQAMGKALDSPKEGVTALQRMIGRISPEIRAQIDSLVEQNRILEAQQVILAEIQKRVGGAGAGAAGGIAGDWHRVKNAIDDAKKSLAAFMVQYAEWWRRGGLFGKPPNETNWNVPDADRLQGGTLPDVTARGGLTSFEQSSQLRDLMASGAATESEVKRLRNIRKEYRDALNQLNATTADALGMTEEALRERRLAIGRELKALNDLFAKSGPGKFMLAELERQHEEITEFFRGFDLKGAQPVRDALRSEEIRVEEALRDLDIRGRDIFAQGAEGTPLRDSFRRPLSQAAAELTELGKQADDTAKLYEQTWENAIKGVQRSFADFFSGLFEEGTNLVSFFKSVANAIRDAFANLLSAQLTGFLFKALGLTASVKHAGGLVGEGGPSRMVSPLAFLGAPRLHSGGVLGLRGDEVPAILQRGETVLPRGVSPVAQGGDTFNLSVNLNASSIDARGLEAAVMSVYPAITAAVAKGMSQSLGARRAIRGF